MAQLESLGRADVEVLVMVLVLGLASGVVCATPCRRALRLVKYRAEPNPVRRAEGSVPRHRLRIGCGEARMVLRVGRRAEVWDCWTRVLRRSAGWRRMADVRPEKSPAVKWKVVLDAVAEVSDYMISIGCLG